MAATKQYAGDGLVVGWEPSRCIHARECVESRCGGSADKPFCDGSHRTDGIEG
jgi:CDGSH-type Zn-finger protein